MKRYIITPRDDKIVVRNTATGRALDCVEVWPTGGVVVRTDPDNGGAYIEATNAVCRTRVGGPWEYV